MRKSERLRLLEMQVLKLEFQVDLMDQYLSAIIENMGAPKPDLDAGKWYQRKIDGTH
jgi:hypothetical protein